MGSGDETDYLCRAYLAGAVLEYVPDMMVFHHHGRKTNAAGYKLWRGYMIGGGGLYAKYLFKHPNLCRRYYWDIKNAAKEIITGSNTFLPQIGFSHKHKAAYAARGAIKYFLLRKNSIDSVPAFPAQRGADYHYDYNPRPKPGDFLRLCEFLAWCLIFSTLIVLGVCCGIRWLASSTSRFFDFRRSKTAEIDRAASITEEVAEKPDLSTSRGA